MFGGTSVIKNVDTFNTVPSIQTLTYSVSSSSTPTKRKPCNNLKHLCLLYVGRKNQNTTPKHTQRALTSLLLCSSSVSPPLALSIGSDLVGEPGLSPSPSPEQTDRCAYRFLHLTCLKGKRKEPWRHVQHADD